MWMYRWMGRGLKKLLIIILTGTGGCCKGGCKEVVESLWHKGYVDIAVSVYVFILVFFFMLLMQ